uniref:Uncharacterized protein n=1 Tax=Panagrolaimus sp. ES5 TaxID=591445 RepID=A0AC34G0W2_9BILA
MNKSCNISFFEAKIAEKQRYLESLKEAVQKGGDLTSWCNGFVENMDDLLDVLIFCKNKFHKKENEVDSPAPTLPSHTPTPPSSSLSPRAPPYRYANPPPASSSSSENFGAPADLRSSADFMAIREEENRCSVLVMNLPECDSFDPSEKRAFDFAHVKVMLKCSGSSADVKNVLRFSPKFLEAGRPPFLKVSFTSEEEKKKALFILIGSVRRIRALDNKYVNVAFTDCDKSGKDSNNVSSNFPRLNPSSPFQRNSASSTSNPINSSSPPKFGDRYNSSTSFKNDSSPRNRMNAPTVSDRVNSSSTTFLPRSNTTTTISRFNSSPAYNRASTSPFADADRPSSSSFDHNAIVPSTKPRVRKMFASTTSRSSSLGFNLFTATDDEGKK